jgi:N-acyl homoserine lactone hydrolase
MKRSVRFAAILLTIFAAAVPVSVNAAAANVERLYVLNCGEGVAGDISIWSPGVDVGTSKEFVDNCYLIKHGKDWFLWDTGLADAVADAPNGFPSPDPRFLQWRRPKKLASQLDAIGVNPADIKSIAVSHPHPDHAGNIDMFPNAMLYVQGSEYDWAATKPALRFAPEHPVTKLDGDRDIFDDGGVTILSTPGHTPGHQSLLVRLLHTGAVVLSGDAVHFKSNWDNRRVPSINNDRDKSLASMERLADILKAEKAQLWINHDKTQRDTLKMSPEYYD